MLLNISDFSVPQNGVYLKYSIHSCIYIISVYIMLDKYWYTCLVAIGPTFITQCVLYVYFMHYVCYV